MIPKGGGKKACDPNSYRPISLISCLGKLVERVVSKRLVKYLEDNKILACQQSGFRSRRRTTDNLAFFSQKIAETLCRKKKLVSLSFDIQAAFDTVWHTGLLYKMIDKSVPNYIIRWVHHFLNDRTFRVRVEEAISESAPIGAGVPQGASISPVLFCMYINDIPMMSSDNIAHSMLFADDLTTFFTFDKVGGVAGKGRKHKVQNYLDSVERWLRLWRLKMAPSKCNYTIFGNAGCDWSEMKDKIAPKMFGEAIPYEANPVLLGVTFDERLTFRAQVQSIRAKCASRLRLIKMMSCKSRHVSKSTLLALYKSLIGTVLDYSALILPRLAKDAVTSLQAIQNKAMRSIYNRPFDATTEELCQISGLCKVEERMKTVNEKYIKSCISFKNEFVVPLIESFKNFIGKQLPGMESLFLFDHKHLFM